MLAIAVMFADRYGNYTPPALRGPMALVALVITIIAFAVFALSLKRNAEDEKPTKPQSLEVSEVGRGIGRAV